ncbi:HD domain-containing protein [Paludisphaera borealis]|uniref:Multifunctional CCA protein n=1 Tax=Paludisphaera borealis TaxID=1387353 RepID=A0A1U7CUZ6_9BACT|nr:HD domain-containing protein [Paludisphaera borealis]APW62755.1 Multifunctional CCA protein [Paludisphaera borealis]
MADERIRRQIAFLAAQLMYHRTESEYFTAKRKAAKQLGVEYRFRPADLPSNAEIRDQIQAMARIHEGPKRLDHLRDMRFEALRLMRKLARFRPRLIGSVWTGHVRQGSDIDIHIFSDSQAIVTDVLQEFGLEYEVEHKRIVKYGEERVFTHIHIDDRFPYELTLYPEDKVHYVFKSSITGQPIERASIAELEAALKAENPDVDLDFEVERVEDQIDRFELYRMLLRPLEGVKQSPKHHPEGDALYHSLQVFELARDERGYDEEFLLAALLHDVGKAIDPADHVVAGLQALEGTITQRTETLIALHMDALAYRDGSLGARARSRLEQSEEFDDLMLLRELDSRGRQPGAIVCELEEALDYIRDLAEEYEE